MNIIFVSRSHGKAKTLSLNGAWLLGFGIFILVLLTVAFASGYWTARDAQDQLRQESFIADWSSDLQFKQQEVERMRQQADERLNQLAVRVAKMHARLIRLDALGEHLTAAAKLNPEEFDFSFQPALGGPDMPESEHQVPDFIAAIDALSQELEARERSLDVLNTMLGDQSFEADRFISGRPIKRGWLSSRFGRRIDPFTGKTAWHEGIDFAGKEGADVIAVAAGVVTWAAERHGYGLMVEINHGGVYSTRYAHAKELLVGLGEVVEKGQTVALMGSSGRSTGPHVHFELLKNGNPIDPYRYVRRKPLKR